MTPRAPASCGNSHLTSLSALPSERSLPVADQPTPSHVGDLDDPMHKYLCPVCQDSERRLEREYSRRRAAECLSCKWTGRRTLRHITRPCPHCGGSRIILHGLGSQL